MNKNETIADIRKEAEARFRALLEKHVDSLGHIQAMQQFNQVFDRIEAAWSCEVQSLQGTIVKLNDAIAEKQKLNENSKSAQFEFCKFQRLLKAVRCLCDEVFNYMKVCNPSVAGGCELRRALENVKDALALFSNSLKNENSDDAIITPVNNAAAMRDIPKPDPNWKDVCAKCMEGEIEPEECEYYGEPNGCNSPIYGEHPKSAPVGNAAAMREALLKVSSSLCPACRRRNCKGCTRAVAEFMSAVRKALTLPPRNCDVGTAEEQDDRMTLYCYCQTRKCERCQLWDNVNKGVRCEFTWSQMPYTEPNTDK